MGQSEREFDIFFSNSVVAVGWSRVNFSSFAEPTSLASEVQRVYYESSSAAPQVVGRWLNEVRRFKRIRAGDRIVVPYHNSVRFAVAEALEIYDCKLIEKWDLANQRRVQYIRTEGEHLTIPRTNLSEGLQRRLRVRGTTVADLYEFRDELEELWRGEQCGWLAQVEKAETKRVEEFKDALLRNIRSGKTNLQAGGYGLEELVRKLLTCEGYQAKILSKRAFPSGADADVIATRSDRFGETKLLVQVKHHRGQSGTFGAEQLTEVIRTRPDEYSDYNLVFVSTADASPDLRALCAERGIVIVSGTELVDWIFDSLSHLDPKTRVRLGISDVPSLAMG